MKQKFTFLSAVVAGLLFSNIANAETEVAVNNYRKTLELANGVKLRLNDVDTTKSQGMYYDDSNFIVVSLPETAMNKTKTFTFDLIYPATYTLPVLSSNVTSVYFPQLDNPTASDGSKPANPNDVCSKALDAVYALPATYSGSQIKTFKVSFSPKDRVTGSTVIAPPVEVVVMEAAATRSLAGECKEEIVSGLNTVYGYLELKLDTDNQSKVEIVEAAAAMRTLGATSYQYFTLELVAKGTNANTGVADPDNAAGFTDFATDNSIAFPNPVNDVLYTTENVEIFNFSGVKVSEGNGTINVSDLEKGLYLVKSKNAVSKIVKN